MYYITYSMKITYNKNTETVVIYCLDAAKRLQI